MAIGDGMAEFRIEGYDTRAACERAAAVMIAKQTTPRKSTFTCKAERKA